MKETTAKKAPKIRKSATSARPTVIVRYLDETPEQVAQNAMRGSGAGQVWRQELTACI